MTDDRLLQEILDKDWTELDLRQAADLLSQLEQSDNALAALRDMDRLKSVIGPTPVVAEPVGSWASFEQRLLDRLAPGQPLGGVALAPFRLPICMGVIAALMALAVTGWVMYSLSPPILKSAPAPIQAADFARISPHDLDERIMMFHRVAEVFDDRTTWVAVSDQASEVGLAAQPVQPQERLVLLRLSVSRSGTLVSRSDLIIVWGRDAELTLPFEHGTQLRYRVGTTLANPGRLALSIELRDLNGRKATLAALATQLHARPGDVVKAGEFATVSGSYKFEVGLFEAT